MKVLVHTQHVMNNSWAGTQELILKSNKSVATKIKVKKK